MLHAEIATAFRDLPYPGDAAISATDYDDEGTSRHFVGTRWQDHQFPELEHFTASLHFFTPSAFAFFLPAFLVAACENPNSGLADAVARCLSPPKNDPSRPSYALWWSCLNAVQQRAVIAVLRELEAKGVFIPCGAIASLEAHHVA